MVIGICDDEKNTRDLIERYIRTDDEYSIINHFQTGEEVLGYDGTMRITKDGDIFKITVMFKKRCPSDT